MVAASLNLCHAFPGLTIEKLKAGIFDGPQIRQLRDPEVENSMKNFLGNSKARNYAELVTNMLTAFRNLECNMSIEMHYLFSHGSVSRDSGQWVMSRGRDSIRT